MSHHLDQTIADAATNNLSFPATLERLADLELEARRRRSIERRVKMSRLQAQHSIDAFNFAGAAEDQRRRCKNKVAQSGSRPFHFTAPKVGEDSVIAPLPLP